MIVCSQSMAMKDMTAFSQRSMKTIEGRPIYPSLNKFYLRFCMSCDRNYLIKEGFVKGSLLDCAKHNVNVLYDADEPIATRVHLLRCDQYINTRRNNEMPVQKL